jgi:hypothetical protein
VYPYNSQTINLEVVRDSTTLRLALRPGSPYSNIRKRFGIISMAVVRILMGTACHPSLRKCVVSNLLVAPGAAPEQPEYENYPAPEDEDMYDDPPVPSTSRGNDTSRKRTQHDRRH